MTSPLEAIKLARDSRTLADGTPIPAHLRSTLLVLATYWPRIHPSVERLADDLGITRRPLLARLSELERLGLVSTRQRGNGQTAERTLHLDRLSSAVHDTPAKTDSSAVHDTPAEREGASSAVHDTSAVLSTAPKGSREGSSRRANTLPTSAPADEVAAILKRTRRKVDRRLVAEAVADYARTPEHALRVAEQLAEEVGSGKLHPSRRMAVVYATRLRTSYSWSSPSSSAESGQG
jgi:DNA-binding transcriptional MocR family regulator